MSALVHIRSKKRLWVGKNYWLLIPEGRVHKP
jgi:hypothetical protein